VMHEQSQESREKMGYLGSETAFGMGNAGTSYWMLRARRGESNRPIEEDERPLPIAVLISLVTLLAMGAAALWRLVRRKGAGRRRRAPRC